jgi:hypothetical protein
LPVTIKALDPNVVKTLLWSFRQSMPHNTLVGMKKLSICKDSFSLEEF